MFENFDFEPGMVTYNPYTLSPEDMNDIKCLNEDMLQVVYPAGYLLDMGWYGKASTLKGVFVIYIIKNGEWEKPMYKQEYRSVTELYEGMRTAIHVLKLLCR